MSDLDEMLHNPVSRRAFLARMTAAGLGAAAVALLAGCGGSSKSTIGGTTGPTTPPFSLAAFPGIPGIDANTVVLNYALTLETLEADLYRQALYIASGKTPADAQDKQKSPELSDYSALTLGVGTVGLDANSAAVGFLYLQQYAGVEAAHRDFLRTVIPTLGATPVSAPAKGYTTGLAAGADLKTILTLIQTVEETGVRAYLGAGPYLTDFGILQTAVAIYSTEARHSAGVNYVLNPSAAAIGPAPRSGDNKVSGPPNTPSAAVTYPSPNTFEYYLTPTQVLTAVKGFFL